MIEKICRFCLDSSDEEDLCSPCKCKGSQKYVHGRCIIKHLLLSGKKECSVCKYKFVDEVSINPIDESGIRWGLIQEDLVFFWNKYLANLFSRRLLLSSFFIFRDAIFSRGVMNEEE